MRVPTRHQQPPAPPGVMRRARLPQALASPAGTLVRSVLGLLAERHPASPLNRLSAGRAQVLADGSFARAHARGVAAGQPPTRRRTSARPPVGSVFERRTGDHDIVAVAEVDVGPARRSRWRPIRGAHPRTVSPSFTVFQKMMIAASRGHRPRRVGRSSKHSTPATPGACGKRRTTSRSASGGRPPAVHGPGSTITPGCDKIVPGPPDGLTGRRAPGGARQGPRGRRRRAGGHRAPCARCRADSAVRKAVVRDGAPRGGQGARRGGGTHRGLRDAARRVAAAKEAR